MTRPSGTTRKFVAGFVIAALIAGLFGGGYVLFLGGGVSKEEFIEQADQICQRTFDESLALAESMELDPADLQSNGRYFRAEADLLREQTAAIVGLEAPDEDRRTLDAWLNTQRALEDVFQAAGTAALAGDQEDFDAAFAVANTIQGRSSQLAGEYGFAVCGSATPA